MSAAVAFAPSIVNLCTHFSLGGCIVKRLFVRLYHFLNGNRGGLRYGWNSAMTLDMFPRTDKIRKMLEKPIDMFPRTDEGVRHSCNQLVPC